MCLLTFTWSPDFQNVVITTTSDGESLWSFTLVYRYLLELTYLYASKIEEIDTEIFDFEAIRDFSVSYLFIKFSTLWHS